MSDGVIQIGDELIFCGIHKAVWELSEEIIGWMRRKDDKLAHGKSFGRSRAQDFRCRRIDKNLIKVGTMSKTFSYSNLPINTYFVGASEFSMIQRPMEWHI